MLEKPRLGEEEVEALAGDLLVLQEWGGC